MKLQCNKERLYKILFIGRVVVFTFGRSSYLKQVSVIALNVTITRARTLVHSSVLPRLLLQHVLYIDKWVHSLQQGLPLYLWRPQRELQGLIWGWAKSPGTGGGRGSSSSVRQSSSGKSFQSFVIHFGMPPLTSLWTCLALQGNGEGSRAFCIVVRGKQGSDSHDCHSPRSGRGEDPAQRWTRGVVIGHMGEAEQQKDLMSARRPSCFARL